MEKINFQVTCEEAGTRVDKCVAVRLGKDYSRTYVKFLMDRGMVSVNGKVSKPSHVTREGDAVSLELLPLPSQNDIAPENIPLNILYEDNCIIVLNKPAGIVVHPGAGNKTGTLVAALLHHCGALPSSDDNDNLRPGIVHRLDKDTSGVIIVAKNAKALRSLAKQFQKRAIKKRYVAIVAGRVELDNGIIDAPIARHEKLRKQMAINLEQGRSAKTIYHVVKRFKKFTIVRLEPETGRTHQLRVHMKYLGFPIVGDSVYGGDKNMARHALHAEMLGVSHPETGKYMEFTAPMPEDMKEFVEQLASFPRKRESI